MNAHCVRAQLLLPASSALQSCHVTLEAPVLAAFTPAQCQRQLSERAAAGVR